MRDARVVVFVKDSDYLVNYELSFMVRREVAETHIEYRQIDLNI